MLGRPAGPADDFRITKVEALGGDHPRGGEHFGQVDVVIPFVELTVLSFDRVEVVPRSVEVRRWSPA